MLSAALGAIPDRELSLIMSHMRIFRLWLMRPQLITRHATLREFPAQPARQSQPAHPQIGDRAPERINEEKRAVSLEAPMGRDRHGIGAGNVCGHNPDLLDGHGDRCHEAKEHRRDIVQRPRAAPAMRMQIDRPKFSKWHADCPCRTSSIQSICPDAILFPSVPKTATTTV